MPAPLRRFVAALLIALIGLGACRYFKWDAKNVTGVGDYYDLTYYYLNSKYFPELGYTHLYEAMLLADAEGARRLRKVSSYRELVGYELVPARSVRGQADAIKRSFSAERWTAFRADVDFLTAQRVNWPYFFRDHGYNPPPTWTVVGRLASSNVELASAKWITSIDFVLVGAMFAAVGFAFGELAMLSAMLFFFWTFSSVWPLVGQALLRFDWVAMAVFALCAAQRGRHALAGGCLAYSALMRVFPAVLFFPWLVSMGATLLQERRLTREQLRFVAGAAVVTLVLVGAALATLGVDAFDAGVRKILLHSGPESFSSMRVGLGNVLVFHGEATRAAIDLHGGIPGKAEQIRALLPRLRFVGVLMLALIGAVTLARHRREPHAAMALGVIPMFVLTTPNISYFNIRVVLIVTLVAIDRDRVRAVGALLLLALAEALGYYGRANGVMYYANSLTSVGLTLAFGFLALSYLVALLSNPEYRPARIAGWPVRARVALGSLAVLLVVVPLVLHG